MNREQLQKVRDALAQTGPYRLDQYTPRLEAIAILDRELAKPVQEPVASISVTQLSAMAQSLEVDKNQTGYHWRKGWNDALRQAMDYAMPVSTAPVAAPQREWVGLTEDERFQCRTKAIKGLQNYIQNGGEKPDMIDVIVEAALRAKNEVKP